jgi:hypothetical protein
MAAATTDMCMTSTPFCRALTAAPAQGRPTGPGVPFRACVRLGGAEQAPGSVPVS